MKSEEWQQQNRIETNDKIKALKEQALDWIEEELSSYNPEYIPEGIGDAFLEENWGELELYQDWWKDCPEPLADILQRILNEVRLQKLRKKRLRNKCGKQ